MADFNTNGYGGFSTEEAQRTRAKRALAIAAMQALCSNYVVGVLETHRCEEIVETLVRKEGFRRVIVPIGHEANSPLENKNA